MKVKVTHNRVEIDGFLFDVNIKDFRPSTFGQVFSSYYEYVRKVREPASPTVVMNVFLTRFVEKGRRIEFLKMCDHFTKDLIHAFEMWKKQSYVKNADYVDTDSVIVTTDIRKERMKRLFEKTATGEETIMRQQRTTLESMLKCLEGGNRFNIKSIIGGVTADINIQPTSENIAKLKDLIDKYERGDMTLKGIFTAFGAEG